MFGLSYVSIFSFLLLRACGEWASGRFGWRFLFSRSGSIDVIIISCFLLQASFTCKV